MLNNKEMINPASPFEPSSLARSNIFSSSDSLNVLRSNCHGSDGEEHPIVYDGDRCSLGHSPQRRSHNMSIDSETSFSSSVIDDEAVLTGTRNTLKFYTCWLCHPNKTGHRMLALTMMCLMGFGSYFCFDTPGALQNQIRDIMGISAFQFSNLYALYSWPNVILPIVGGILIDGVLGLRNSATFFSFTLVVGQALCGLGAFTKTFSFMEIGRFVFGIGGESLAVAQNTYTSLWFTGTTLNMVFGLQLSISRLGSTANFQVVGPLYDALLLSEEGHRNKSEISVDMGHDTGSIEKRNALGWTLIIAGLSCVFSLFATIILGYMDRRAEKILRYLIRRERANNTNPFTSNETLVTGRRVDDNTDNSSQQQFSLGDIKKFDARFWTISTICVTYYVAIFPFISLGQVFFMSKFSMTSASANFINGLIYLISSVASPALGLLVDFVGRNLIFVLISVAFTLVGHVLLAFTYLTPYVAVFIMGFSYSTLASSLWPLVTYVVAENRQGTAFGIMQSVQNLGLAVISMAAGGIVDNYGYFYLECFYIIFLAISLVASIAVIGLDLRKDGGVMNMSAKQRHIFTKLKSERDSIHRRASERGEKERGQSTSNSTAPHRSSSHHEPCLF